MSRLRTDGHTVDAHLRSIFLKLGVSDRISAAVRAIGMAAVLFDVTDEAAVAAGVAEAEAALGRIDILVNNAGVQQRGPLTERGRISLHS